MSGRAMSWGFIEPFRSHSTLCGHTQDKVSCANMFSTDLQTAPFIQKCIFLTMLPWLISRHSLFKTYSILLKIRQGPGQEGPKFKSWVTTATAGSVQCQRRIYGHPAPTWLDWTDFFTLSVDMFTRPTEACQRTWPPPRLLAEKTNDLGCPRPTLSATAAATSVLLHLCHNYYFSSLLSAAAACFYSTNPIGHSVILLRLDLLMTVQKCPLALSKNPSCCC